MTALNDNGDFRKRPRRQATWEVIDKDGKIFAAFSNWQQAHDWARWNMSGEQDSSGDHEGQNGWDVRTAGCE